MSATGESVRIHSQALAGFTLLELMVVIAIMSLLCAAMPVAFDRMAPKARLVRAANELEGNLLWLQMQARATGTVARLEKDSYGYSLTTSSHRRRVELSDSVKLRIRTSDKDTELTLLSAYADGSVTPAEYELASSQQRLTFRIQPLTGRVEQVERR